MKVYEKDPSDVLDYPFEYAGWLAEEAGDTITASTFAVDPGITVVSEEFITETSKAVIWLSGGEHGKAYRVTNHVTTAGGRELERSIEILVWEQ